MKCGSPYPKSSYQECQLDLMHDEDHDYLGTKWPRVEPAELDPAIAELLEATTPPRTYGINERSYPVVVVETVTRIVWVDAESEDEALAYWADDFADLDLDNGTVLDGDLEFQRPNQWQRQDAMTAAGHGRRHVGPQIACPGCGALSFNREWYHDPYRHCHGPIQWREGRPGRPYRVHNATPVQETAREPVAA